ncbi:crotonase/enoyl-CoA hydratase family protein [Roseibium sp. RKSG952]|uniref:crotonase/enoyl-CoA hydratase family protein n=1 Tax=Roseibium sp. RKSG952 TaxID=2529384 RepID=UPI0012BCC91F|nr:crotonase/enoyl-CoA hydratase family protein [Roseibium sp. RKSG952]MTH96108.1 crotonase/enoyl-CoA hydratase family protein [Roseibium sp. RKSG952]
MITLSMEEGVRILRLDRPEKKNALTTDMYSALAEALESGNHDDQIRCQVICGHDGAFTSGNDVGDFLKNAGNMGEDAPVVRFLRALVGNQKPLVASVNGIAFGVGATLLLHCDMVFASPQSVIRSPFVDLGLIPEAGSTLLGPQTMGYQKAFELLIAGRPFPAQKAYEAGLVNEVVEDVDAAAIACAKEIAAKPPQAMKLARDFMRGDVDALARRVDDEAKVFAERLTSKETITAFTNFMTKKAKV